MALPTPDNLKTMDYVFQGQPFVNVPAKTGLSLQSMDYAFQAQPFVPNPEVVGGLSIPVAMQNIRGGFNPIGMRGGFVN